VSLNDNTWDPLLLRLPIDHLRTHDRQIAHVPSGLTDDRAVAGNAHRAPDMAGELGLVFGKQPDLPLLLVPVAFLVEHAHGLGQPQHEGAEPRAVGMLMAIAVKSAPGRNRQTYERTAQSRLARAALDPTAPRSFSPVFA